MGVSVDELVVADRPGAWGALGFGLDGDSFVLGEIRVRAGGESSAGAGPLAWALRGLASTELDGLPTCASERPPPGPGPIHPNGVNALDHVVAITPQLERTVAALGAAGLDLRRIREQPTPAGAPRQAFFRLGGTILEVVEEPADLAARNGRDRPAFFWGLAFVCEDLDATLAELGPELVGEPRTAVQPGRRIATLRRAAGLSVPVALMTPRPPR